MIEDLCTFGSFLTGEDINYNYDGIIMFVNINMLERSYSTEFEELKQENMDKYPYTLAGKIAPKGPLTWPFAPFTPRVSTGNHSKKSALNNRILSWFKTYMDNDVASEILEIIDDNFDDIEDSLDKMYEPYKKERKKVYISIKINGKYVGDVPELLNAVKIERPKVKKGRCCICNKDTDIVTNYKDISSKFGFYTLDKNFYAQNLDIKNFSYDFPLCNPCRENLIGATNYLIEDNSRPIHLSGPYFLTIIPSSINSDYENQVKNFLKKWDSLSRVEIEKDNLESWLIAPKSPDTFLPYKNYLFFKKDKQVRQMVKYIGDVPVSKINRIIKLFRKVKKMQYGLFHLSGVENDLFNLIFNTVYYNSYSHKASTTASVNYTLYFIENQIKMDKLEPKFQMDFINESGPSMHYNFSDAINSNSAQSARFNPYCFLHGRALRNIFIITMIELFNMESDSSPENNDASKFIQNEYSVYIDIGSFVRNLVDLQKDVNNGVSPFEKKLYYIAGSKRIKDIFSDASSKLREYEIFDEFKKYKNNTDWLRHSIAKKRAALEYDIDDRTARFFFEIGYGMTTYKKPNKEGQQIEEVNE